jgi:serine/threonine-protein kinase HipA
MMAKNKTLSYDTSRPVLDVYLRDRLIGCLGLHDADVWFRYDEGIVADAHPERWQLSVRLRPRTELYGPDQTRAFFDNLLAESDVRAVLARATKHDISDLPGLLGQVAGECAGAVSLWPHGTPPAKPEYRALTESDLRRLFSQAHGELLTRAQLESRQSMSGAQDKLVFRKTGTGYDLPLAGAPGNVILKRPSSRYDGLVENEVACLRLVDALGLSIPKTRGLVGEPNLLESERFDRVEPDLRRLHQEDFCQATGRLAVHKYQRNRGPTFNEIADVLNKNVIEPSRDVERLVRITLLNVCIGNFDAHAKNFALFYADDGLRLAPFYDVVSSEVYEFLTPEYAIFVGHAQGPNQLDYGALVKFARMVNWQPGLMFETIEQTTAAIEQHWPAALHTVATEFGNVSVLDRLEGVIKRRLRTLREASVPPTAARMT